MENKQMTLEVVTPEKTQCKETITYINVPTVAGSIGILYNHAPIVTLVEIGRLNYTRSDGEEVTLVITEGVLELHDNKITLLVNAAETPEDIDSQRAAKAKERALNRLDQKTRDVDFARAEAALKRAMIRLKTVGKE